MSQRLFRYADLMAHKYSIVIESAAKLRPKSKAQIEREQRALERLQTSQIMAEDTGVESEEGKKALQQAKSDFVEFFNTYLSPEDIAYGNPYSPLSQGVHVGKNKILRELYTFGSREAKEIFKLLEDLFPKDKDGNIDHVSLAVLANRINSIMKVLTDETKVGNMVRLIRSRFPQDFMSEPLIKNLNSLKQAATDILPNLAKTFAIYAKSSSVKPIEDPAEHQHIPQSPLWREKTNWRLGMYGVDEDTMNFIGVTSDEDFQIANTPEIKPVFEYVMSQTRQGVKRPKGGEHLKSLIQKYKEKQRLERGTNVSELEQQPEAPSPRVLDKSFTLKNKEVPEGPTVMRNQQSDEELRRLYREMQAREETGTGGGDTSI